MLNKETIKDLYVPKYYTKFECLADKCSHNCCIDWEICIDEKTLAKYTSNTNISRSISKCEDGFCFSLDESGRCPHLNESGLCNIIITYGEDYLCEICKNHPRFFNVVNTDIVEGGIGIACEEACRLVLENDSGFFLTKIDEVECYETFIDEPPCEFNALSVRNEIIFTIEASKAGFDEKVALLKEKFDIFDMYSIDEWLGRFLSLEILDNEWENLLKSLNGKTVSAANARLGLYDRLYERLLVYFIYRHVSIANSVENLRARLAFSILSVEFIRYLFELDTEQNKEILFDYARRYSAEIEYSDNNISELIFDFECML